MRLNRLNLLLMISIFILVISPSYAAQSSNLREQNPVEPQSLYVLPSAAHEQDLLEIQEINRETDAYGNTHIRSRQTYLGYPVWGSQKLTHISSKGEKTENGIVFQGIGVDLQNTPSFIFSKSQSDLAIQKAIGLYVKKSVKVQVLRQNSQLMVYVDDTKKAHWVFQVELYIEFTNTAVANPFYLMDAKTFEVYKKWDGISHFDIVKVGGLGGNPKIGIVIYDGSPANKPLLEMRRDQGGTCYLQNDRVTVKDGRLIPYNSHTTANSISIFPSVHDNIDPDANPPPLSFKCDQTDPAHGNIYWDGALDPVNGALSPGNDALYLADQVNSMYENWYHIPVIHNAKDNKPMVNMLIHDKWQYYATFFFGSYDLTKTAIWDSARQEARFGDHDETLGYPLVTPDIVAHELSHGFSNQHANFFPNMGDMAGGIDESFSDMAAKAFEYYRTGQTTWTIEAKDISDYEGTIRYLDEPTKDCQNGKQSCSIDNAKNFQSNLDVHFSAGVFNKAFYLLSTSPGWNPHKAFDIMVQANRYYWTKYLDFQEAACGVWDAAKDKTPLHNEADLAIITNVMNQVGLEASEEKCHPWLSAVKKGSSDPAAYF